MTVRKEADKFGYKNIVMPIDFSEHSRQKVNATLDLASKFGAKIHILGVLSDDDTVHDDKMRAYIKQIEDLCDKTKVAHVSKIEHAKNRAHQTLKYAKSVNADMVVTMADQDAEISSIVLGTYAHQLINYSKIPVITFAPEMLGDIHISFAGLS
jgi:nucleotide-binding universal stress UspA family protein